ncbi:MULTISPECIES: molybdate ABC transporter substrate-binding protein [unclassified Helicobacter]|uniref:molybdate ABC transporter substrate-binding protein n=1 Tax=unclassified Helicobacter TaxID=2593540 RepID=UPI000CF18A5E|nr:MULTISPECIES: molybdate ABC transporter substrate-binding protein [unclassified Helicobacter]
MKKLLLSFMLLCSTTFADTINILAAANLSKVLEEIKENFLKQHKTHQIHISFLSSGKAYAQIKNNASVDLFISADTSYPQKLFEDNLASKPQVYAQGILVLWSKTTKLQNLDNLLEVDIKKIALPNPNLAPYGRAGKEVLEKTGLYKQIQDKLIQATSISQAHQWVESKNAQAGFGALSLIDKDNPEVSFIIIDPSLYTPIKQALSITKSGQTKQLAKDFANFILHSQDIFKKYGYLVP